jgi:hypothetical protein
MNPDRPEQPKLKHSSIGQFAIKTGIVVTGAFLFFVLAINYLDSVIDARVEQFQFAVGELKNTKIGGRELLAKLEGQLENQAKPTADLPPEKKQKIIEQIRTVSDRWRPFVKDAFSAVIGEAANPPTRHELSRPRGAPQLTETLPRSLGRA